MRNDLQPIQHDVMSSSNTRMYLFIAGVGWYDGPESGSIKKSMKQLSDTMWFCPQDTSLKLSLPGIN